MISKNSIRYAMLAGQSKTLRREYMVNARQASNLEDRAFWARMARHANRNVLAWVSLARWS